MYVIRSHLILGGTFYDLLTLPCVFTGVGRCYRPHGATQNAATSAFRDERTLQ